MPTMNAASPLFGAIDGIAPLVLVEQRGEGVLVAGDRIGVTKSEGFYPKAEVDALADRSALFHLQNVSQGVDHTEFVRATLDDIQGIFNVVASLWGG